MGARLGVSFDGFSPFHEPIPFGKEADASGATSLWVADHSGYRESILSVAKSGVEAAAALVSHEAVHTYVVAGSLHNAAADWKHMSKLGSTTTLFH